MTDAVMAGLDAPKVETVGVMPPEAPSRPHAHYPGLDTLRAAAILMVIPFHAWLILGGGFMGPTVKSVVKHGWAGVELFFVLSGFLIGSQLLQSMKRDGRVHFGRFYLKRSLRILPSYYAVLLLYYAWPAFREKPEIGSPWPFLLFFMNYGRQGEAFSHAWSLCVEEHFYLVFPAIVAICAAWAKRLRPIYIVSVVFTFEFLWRYHLWTIGSRFFTYAYRPSHAHLDGLVVGIVLALMREHRGSVWAKIIARPWELFVGGIVFVSIGMGMYQNVEDPAPYVLTFTVVALGFGALLMAAIAPGFWLSKARIPGAAFVATLAFTLYLTHKQMIHMAMEIVGDYKDRPMLTVALSVVLVALASCVLHFAIERPALRLRDRILRIRPVVGKGAGTA